MSLNTDVPLKFINRQIHFHKKRIELTSDMDVSRRHKKALDYFEKLKEVQE